MTDFMRYQYRTKGLIKKCNDDERSEALDLIDKRVNMNLIYFWYNLKKGLFMNFKLEDVHKQAVYYIAKYPDYEKEIIQWLTAYERRVKTIEEETQGA